LIQSAKEEDEDEDGEGDKLRVVIRATGISIANIPTTIVAEDMIFF
jgi:hypothetical protein